MKNSSNIGIKLWACYFMITGTFGLTKMAIGYLANKAAYTAYHYVFLLYPLLFCALLVITGLFLFKMNNNARKGAILIACLYLIEVVVLLPFSIYYLINTKPVLLTFLKILFKSSIGSAILMYFNKPRVKSFFKI